MRETLLTFPPLDPAPSPGLFDLRLLERRIETRLADLDARVDFLLALPGAPTDAQVAAVDVLCAAIAETQELLDEARRDAAGEARRRRERRQTPRRWS